jgi:hypothetical protein
MTTRATSPASSKGADWLPEVASFAVESEGVSILLDPLAPPPGAGAVWERIAASSPSVVAVLKPDHLRDVELFVRWYGARAFRPFLFWANDLPRTDLERLRPDDVLPGGPVALHDGREGMETPLYLPEQRALLPSKRHCRSRPGASEDRRRYLTTIFPCMNGWIVQ